MFGIPKRHRVSAEILRFRRLDVAACNSIKVGAEIVGNRVRVRVVKNKVSAPFRSAEFDIMYNEGISKSGDILDLATSLEVIEKRGSFYSYKDQRLGQGREASKNYLVQNPDLMQEIEDSVRALANTEVLSGTFDISGDSDEGTATILMPIWLSLLISSISKSRSQTDPALFFINEVCSRGGCPKCTVKASFENL